MSRTEEVNKMTENVYKVQLFFPLVCLVCPNSEPHYMKVLAVLMSCYLCVLLPTGDSGPVQPQSEELCDHGETL